MRSIMVLTVLVSIHVHFTGRHLCIRSSLPPMSVDVSSMDNMYVVYLSQSLHIQVNPE